MRHVGAAQPANERAASRRLSDQPLLHQFRYRLADRPATYAKVFRDVRRDQTGAGQELTTGDLRAQEIGDRAADPGIGQQGDGWGGLGFAARANR